MKKKEQPSSSESVSPELLALPPVVSEGASKFQTYQLDPSYLSLRRLSKSSVLAVGPGCISGVVGALTTERIVKSNQLLGHFACSEETWIAFDGGGLHALTSQGSRLIAETPILSAYLQGSLVVFTRPSGGLGVAELTEEGGRCKLASLHNVALEPELAAIPSPWFVECVEADCPPATMVGLLSTGGSSGCRVFVAGLSLRPRIGAILCSDVLHGRALPLAVSAEQPALTVIAPAGTPAFAQLGPDSDGRTKASASVANAGCTVTWHPYCQPGELTKAYAVGSTATPVLAAWASPGRGVTLALRRGHHLEIYNASATLDGTALFGMSLKQSSCFPGLAYVHGSRRHVKMLRVRGQWALLAEYSGPSAVVAFELPASGQIIAAQAAVDQAQPSDQESQAGNGNQECIGKGGGEDSDSAHAAVLGSILGGDELAVLWAGSLRVCKRRASPSKDNSTAAAAAMTLDSCSQLWGMDRDVLKRVLQRMDEAEDRD